LAVGDAGRPAYIAFLDDVIGGPAAVTFLEALQLELDAYVPVLRQPFAAHRADMTRSGSRCRGGITYTRPALLPPCTSGGRIVGTRPIAKGRACRSPSGVPPAGVPTTGSS
jgi:hypothetical protein